MFTWGSELHLTPQTSSQIAHLLLTAVNVHLLDWTLSICKQVTVNDLMHWIIQRCEYSAVANKNLSVSSFCSAAFEQLHHVTLVNSTFLRASLSVYVCVCEHVPLKEFLQDKSISNCPFPLDIRGKNRNQICRRKAGVNWVCSFWSAIEHMLIF